LRTLRTRVSSCTGRLRPIGIFALLEFFCICGFFVLFVFDTAGTWKPLLLQRQGSEGARVIESVINEEKTEPSSHLLSSLANCQTVLSNEEQLMLTPVKEHDFISNHRAYAPQHTIPHLTTNLLPRESEVEIDSNLRFFPVRRCAFIQCW
jgi:hypothetical protein